MNIRETNSDSDSEYLDYTVSDEAKCLNYPTFVFFEKVFSFKKFF